MESQSTGRNRAPRTVAWYVDQSLDEFRRGMAEHEAGLAPALITRQHVESCLAEIAPTRSPSTAQTRYLALRLFFAWAAEEGEVPSNPMANVKPQILDLQLRLEQVARAPAPGRGIGLSGG